MKDIKSNNGMSFTCLSEEDIFFQMPEKFIEVEFELIDYLASQISILQNQVSIFPTRKLDINIEKNTRSKSFYIFLDEDWTTSDFTHHIHGSQPKID